MVFVFSKVEAGNGDLLKAQLAAPFLDGLSESGEVGSNSRHEARETGAEMRIILPDIGARHVCRRPNTF
jgi:hypothetical protein